MASLILEISRILPVGYLKSNGCFMNGAPLADEI